MMMLSTISRAGRHPARGVTVLVLAAALAVGAVSTANASVITINTDTSWLATDVAPAAGWNTDPLFNTAGWTSAFVSTVTPAPCFQGADCIWFDDQNSATQFVWMRRTFTISGPILSALFDGGVDDDADIFVNGSLVYSVHDGLAGNFGPAPLDLAPFLIQGNNLIAVFAQDNFAFGTNHLFAAQLQIETSTAVPEPSSLVLFAPGLAALALLRRRRLNRQDSAGPSGATT